MARHRPVCLASLDTGVLPWDETQINAVAFAIATLVDPAIFFGFIRPRVTPVSRPRDKDGTPLVPAHRPLTDLGR